MLLFSVIPALPADKRSRLHLLLLFLLVVAACLYFSYLVYLLVEDQWTMTALFFAIGFAVFMSLGMCVINVAQQVKFDDEEDGERTRLIQPQP